MQPDLSSACCDPSTGDEYYHAGNVTIKVIDTGPGLSTQQQEQMFQEGVQFNPNELQGGQGSGLGLWISREIIQQHGGSISVMSEGLGKGSTFTITLPVLLPSFSKSRRQCPSTRITRSHREVEEGSMMLHLPLRVLVVDDAKSNAKILSRLLENAGMQVTMAFDGKECIKKVKECSEGSNPFELIVMDYVMPIMSGPEATCVLRSLGYLFPIIGLTGNVQPEDIKCFMDAGANIVLPKPLNWTNLLAACKELALEGPEDGGDKSLRGQVSINVEDIV
jgi:CheY-like chemotaxis protein